MGAISFSSVVLQLYCVYSIAVAPMFWAEGAVLRKENHADRWIGALPVKYQNSNHPKPSEEYSGMALIHALVL